MSQWDQRKWLSMKMVNSDAQSYFPTCHWRGVCSKLLWRFLACEVCPVFERNLILRWLTKELIWQPPPLVKSIIVYPNAFAVSCLASSSSPTLTFSAFSLAFNWRAMFLVQETFDYEVLHSERKHNGSTTPMYTVFWSLLSVGERRGIVKMGSRGSHIVYIGHVPYVCLLTWPLLWKIRWLLLGLTLCKWCCTLELCQSNWTCKAWPKSR